MSTSLKVLLAVSLALNLVLAGVIGGHLAGRTLRPHGPRPVPVSPGPELPAEKRALFEQTLERVHLENREVHREIREARRRALAILSAPEFDAEAYRQEADRIHELRGLVVGRLTRATTELAAEFTQEERRALAGHLLRPPRPPRGPGSGRHVPGSPPPGLTSPLQER